MCYALIRSFLNETNTCHQYAIFRTIRGSSRSHRRPVELLDRHVLLLFPTFYPRMKKKKVVSQTCLDLACVRDRGAMRDPVVEPWVCPWHYPGHLMQLLSSLADRQPGLSLVSNWFLGTYVHMRCSHLIYNSLARGWILLPQSPPVGVVARMLSVLHWMPRDQPHRLELQIISEAYLPFYGKGCPDTYRSLRQCSCLTLLFPTWRKIFVLKSDHHVVRLFTKTWSVWRRQG